MYSSLIAGVATLLAIVVLPAQSRAEAVSRAPDVSSLPAHVAKPLPSGVIECTLTSDSRFSGRVVNRSGRAIAGARVAMLTSDSKAVSTKTDGTGRFEFQRVRAGGYVLNVGAQSLQVRVWDARVAPPSARKELLLVSGDVVRAQCEAGWQCDGCLSCETQPQGHFGGVFQRILCNPWIVGAGTAAAIAVPLGTDDDDAS